MEIGSKLKKARSEKGITQEQAAELLDVSRQTISSWENNKSYPDIISVIKMSDIYAVSLDHLLKEEKSMKQTYQEFLEESTNTVKAKRSLEKIILLATYFVMWAVSMLVIWQTNGYTTSNFDTVFRVIILPLFLLISTVIVAKNDYWGKGKWLSVIVAAITFLTVPYTQYVDNLPEGTATFAFCFPNYKYMAVGIIISACGIVIGNLWRKRISLKEKM